MLQHRIFEMPVDAHNEIKEIEAAELKLQVQFQAELAKIHAKRQQLYKMNYEEKNRNRTAEAFAAFRFIVPEGKIPESTIANDDRTKYFNWGNILESNFMSSKPSASRSLVQDATSVAYDHSEDEWENNFVEPLHGIEIASEKQLKISTQPGCLSQGTYRKPRHALGDLTLYPPKEEKVENKRKEGSKKKQFHVERLANSKSEQFLRNSNSKTILLQLYRKPRLKPCISEIHSKSCNGYFKLQVQLLVLVPEPIRSKTEKQIIEPYSCVLNLVDKLRFLTISGKMCNRTVSVSRDAFAGRTKVPPDKLRPAVFTDV